MGSIYHIFCTHDEQFWLTYGQPTIFHPVNKKMVTNLVADTYCHKNNDHTKAFYHYYYYYLSTVATFLLVFLSEQIIFRVLILKHHKSQRALEKDFKF